MEPSKRIYQLIGKTSSDPEWQEKAINAIIFYLDEKYENTASGEMFTKDTDPSKFTKKGK